jgi:hypothetical protein
MPPIAAASLPAPAPPRAPAIRIAHSAPAAPPPSHAPAPSAAVGGATALPRPVPQPARGNDGWATEETQVNKLGTWIVIGVVIVGSLFGSGFVGVQLSGPLLLAVVALGGVIGGILNIAGRGPILAGAFIGLVMALGGYGAVYWWMQGKESVRKFEVIIAMVIGMVPGFLLQAGLQALLKKRLNG